MILSLRDLSFGYSRTPVLEGVTIDIPVGDFFGVLGPNGCGKSTLLRLLNRILRPWNGTILVDGISIDSMTRSELARMIAYVPQETNWVFPFTVEEVVLMGRTPFTGPFGMESSRDRDVAWEAMRLVDLSPLAKKPVTAISGGERQRTLIARALTQEPRILLLDEPNAHLDLAHQLETFRLLRDQNLNRNLTVLCVTHDLNLAALYCSRMVLLAPPQPEGEESAGWTNSMVALGDPGNVLRRETIKKVFSADVLIDRHPSTRVPRITLSPSGGRNHSGGKAAAQARNQRTGKL
jgi:iron complex transport system ATP-binding protein